MKLTEKEFRDHMQGMIDKGLNKQARMWAENGTLIYTNFEQLQDLYDEEYRDLVES